MKKSEERQLFEDIIRSSGNIDENQRFLQSNECIAFTQVLMLTGLSMFCGVFIPILSSIVEKDDSKITWDSGIDVFTWGVYDKDFKRFAAYYQDKLSSKPQFKKYSCIYFYRDSWLHYFLSAYFESDRPAYENVDST